MEDNSHEAQNEPIKTDPMDEQPAEQLPVGHVVQPDSAETPVVEAPANAEEQPAPVVEEQPETVNMQPVENQTEELQTLAPETPVAASPVSVESMVPAQPESPEAPASKRPITAIVMSVLLVFAIGAAGFFAFTSSSANSDVQALENEVAALSATTHELPDSAIKLSECVPNMGFHYLIEGGDPKFGPFYLVNKAGEVIGVEFKYIDDSFTEIPESPIPLAIINPGDPLDLYNWTYEQLEISRALEGHEGFLEDHIDIHAYTVTTEVQAQACQ